jgi:hypothetical protein
MDPNFPITNMPGARRPYQIAGSGLSASATGVRLALRTSQKKPLIAALPINSINICSPNRVVAAARR